MAAAVAGRRLPGRARRLWNAVSATPEESYARTVSHFTPEQKAALYRGEMADAVRGIDSYDLLYARFRESDAPDLLGRALYVDTMTYLPDDLLVKVDIATMAHGLEGRSPFLDHPLVEFAARLPSRYKLHRGGGKHVLRQAVDDLVPESVRRRPKMGFTPPVLLWLRQELKEMVEDTLFSARARARPFFEAAAVRKLWDDHQQGRAERSLQLWALLMLELWCLRFVDR
jgi:asparagine synthase (glutamine-hydrolysing)